MVNLGPISGPDYKNAPITTIDASDIAITFRLPERLSNSHPYIASHIDLSCDSDFESHASIGFSSLELVDANWEYRFINSDLLAGSFMLGMNLWKVDISQHNLKSLLVPQDYQKWLLNYFEAIFQSAGEGSPSFWRPTSGDDLKAFKKDGMPWLKGRFGSLDIHRLYYWVNTPITSDLCLHFTIILSGFVEDHIAPKEEVDKMLDGYIDDFLEHFHIQYSPETLAEMDQYK
ncbi:hypothetical protein HCH_05515 [Hahella chejuensis KCTC 2396]|uniref:Uncharacterized protein n=1 Tax=Hahella chejuensis (strain KCTC 2396) TaxID=349521 RepID=Q2SAZ7_HAHCH|nr:hypothetical protein [Hahella chejuensis]ABC32177.1 hypothetical protein HCH_05515 [Hahella chejuensis KCTC 2396]